MGGEVMRKLIGICLMMVTVILMVSCDKTTECLKNDEPIIQYTRCTRCSDEQVLFSLDKGRSWSNVNNKYPEFDINNILSNEDIHGMVFFHATSYQQLLKEIEKNRTTPFYAVYYPDDDEWNRIINAYNEAYFENYILLFYYKYEPYISENYVYDVTIKDHSLTLNVNRREGLSAATLSAWLELVTIKKEDVVDVTEYNVSVRTISEL